jgi:hypothetical protein
MKKFVEFFLSLKLTVTLLILSMILVFAGTLAQVDKDIWTVMDEYFRCLIAHIDLAVFFPRTWDIPDISFPFPGGFLIGWLLVINLLTVHWASFKIQSTGRRRLAGIAFLVFGVLVTCGVMLGWGAASVAATENAAFWRVFLRLGRGTFSAVVLLIGCILLYRKRAGMVLLHGGILFLLIGEFFTALYAVEARMTIKEGETVDYIDHSQQLELSFTEISNPDHDTVTVIPQNLLKDGARVTPADLPFDVQVHRYMINSARPQQLQSMSEAIRNRYPSYEGYGARLYISEQSEAKGTLGARNAPSVDVELFDRKDGSSIGRYIFSLWFYPNFVNRAWDMPTRIKLADREYEVYFRFKREYLKSASGNPYSIKLLDFVHEKYEGTQMPKDFASQILLINEGDNIERELRIWMNNPLRYARRTFYQSGYLPDDGGTVLQVVQNETWMIPYLSCMIVFIGMATHLIQSLSLYLRRNSQCEK